MSALAVIILAAGKGKRMGSERLPKVLHRLRNRALIDYVLTTACRLSPHHLIIVVGHLKEQVMSHVTTHCTEPVQFAVQEEQRGTGDAVQCTRSLLQDFRGTILVLNGDVPLITVETLQKLLDQHWQQKADLSVLTALLDDPTGYGRIVRDDHGRFVRIVEDRDATAAERKICEVNTGVIAAQAEPLFRALQQLQPDNAQAEYYLTDVVEILVRDNAKVQAVLAADPMEVYGVNRPEHLRVLEQWLVQQAAVDS